MQNENFVLIRIYNLRFGFTILDIFTILDNENFVLIYDDQDFLLDDD